MAAEWNNSGTGDYVYNEVPTGGATYYVNLSDYTGHTVKIGFYGESTVSNADNWFHFGKIRLETVETTNYVDSICEGYSFIDHGFAIPYDQLSVGTNTFSRYDMNADSTMSITIEQVVVTSSSYNEIPVTLCEGEHYNDYGFDFTATDSRTIRRRLDNGNALGCDSTIALQVVVLPTLRAEEHVGCTEDSYTWNGKTYYQSTIATDTTSSLVTGCDSITTLYITFCKNQYYRYHGVFCAGSTYTDEFFQDLRTPGQYTVTSVSEIGCV